MQKKETKVSLYYNLGTVEGPKFWNRKPNEFYNPCSRTQSSLVLSDQIEWLKIVCPAKISFLLPQWSHWKMYWQRTVKNDCNLFKSIIVIQSCPEKQHALSKLWKCINMTSVVEYQFWVYKIRMIFEILDFFLNKGMQR